MRESGTKAVVGFAHSFRPMYPGFPVETRGVEQLHAAFFGRKPHPWWWLVLLSRNPGNAGANMGRPCGSVVPAAIYSGVDDSLVKRSASPMGYSRYAISF